MINMPLHLSGIRRGKKYLRANFEKDFLVLPFDDGTGWEENSALSAANQPLAGGVSMIAGFYSRLGPSTVGAWLIQVGVTSGLCIGQSVVCLWRLPQ